MTEYDKWLVSGTLALAVLLFCAPGIAGEPYLADGRHPVRSLLEMRREGVMIQGWDLSCGAAALAILLRYEFGEPVTEKDIARGLMRRSEYVANPEVLQIREGFSLLDLKRYVNGYGVQAAEPYSPRPKKSVRSKVTSSKGSRGARRSTSARTSIAGLYRGEAGPAGIERPDRAGTGHGSDQRSGLQPFRRFSGRHREPCAGRRPRLG